MNADPRIAILEAEVEWWRTRAWRLSGALDSAASERRANDVDACPPEPPVGTRFFSGDELVWTRRADGWHCSGINGAGCHNCPCDWQEAWDFALSGRGLRRELPGGTS